MIGLAAMVYEPLYHAQEKVSIQYCLLLVLAKRNQQDIDGFHCRHVGGQNKRKFVHIVCIKIEVNSHRRKILLFLSTNMAAMTSHANHQKQYFLIVFNKTIIPLALVGYEMITATRLVGYLSSHIVKYTRHPTFGPSSPPQVYKQPHVFT